MQDLTKDNFEKEVLKSRTPVLVDFWAPWCAPCRIVGPILGKLSSEYATKLKMVKLNVDSNQDIAGKFDIRGIPCIVIFNNGKEIDRIVGAFPESEMRKKIDLMLSKT